MKTLKTSTNYYIITFFTKIFSNKTTTTFNIVAIYGFILQ